MDIKETHSLLYWNYFLSLENDLLKLSRFVEFTEKNYSTYSIEIAHLFLATSSEVDVIAKMICNNYIDKAENMTQYIEELTSNNEFKGLEKEEITIPRYGLILNPWENFIRKESPDWWKEYNKVKHQRNDYFECANLKNLLNSIGGLFLLVLYYYKKIENIKALEPSPCLFVPQDSLGVIGIAAGSRVLLHL